MNAKFYFSSLYDMVNVHIKYTDLENAMEAAEIAQNAFDRFFMKRENTYGCLKLRRHETYALIDSTETVYDPTEICPTLNFLAFVCHLTYFGQGCLTEKHSQMASMLIRFTISSVLWLKVLENRSLRVHHMTRQR